MSNKKTKNSPANSGEERSKSTGRHNTPKERTPGKRVKYFRLKITLAIILGLLSLSITAVTVWAFNITNSDTNLPNVYIGDVNVGGMTEQETIAALEKSGWTERCEERMVVQLPADISFELDIVKSGVMLSAQDAAKCAQSYGHGSNVYGNLAKYLLKKPVDISKLYGEINDEYIRSQVDEALALFAEKTADTGYELDLEKSVIRLMKGAGQMQINAENLSSQLTAAMLQGERSFEKSSPDNKLTVPDFQKIHDEVCVEAQDAAYGEKFEVIDEVVGFDFDISEAEKSWEAAKATEYYEISVSTIQPEITGEELRSRLFRDRLGSQVTKYTYSSDNRINNIKLCASKFDGMILYPGDTFSFNEVVGKRTLEAGFLEAGAYSDGEVVQEVGGGICQVSSTLYCASMYAQMKTMYRESHYFKVDYLPLGYDATVSWSKPDFKFRNDREYPVKLAAYCDDDAKALVVEIWGTDVDGSYVELSCVSSPVYDEEFTEVVIGTSARASRNVYDKDGNFLYKVNEPYSMYHLHEDEIEWPEEAMKDEEGKEGEEDEFVENEGILDGILGALEREDNAIIIG